MKLREKGILFIFSSPSGGGKTTVTREIIASETNITRAIAATTRSPRDGEADGVDYFFKTKSEFQKLCKTDEMLEYATVFNNHYGTLKSQVEKQLNSGIDVICPIDWQGALQIQQKMPSVSVFLLPPSMKVLKERLTERATDTIDVINHRLINAATEIRNHDRYDYIVINNELSHTINTLRSIITAERVKTARQGSRHDFLETLYKQL